MFSFLMPGGLAEYPTLLLPAAKHDSTDASVKDRSGRRPVPAGGVLHRFNLCHETHRRSEVGTSSCVWIPLACLIRPATMRETSSPCLGRTQTSLTQFTGSLSTGRKSDLVPRCYTCGQACGASACSFQITHAISQLKIGDHPIYLWCRLCFPSFPQAAYSMLSRSFLKRARDDQCSLLEGKGEGPIDLSEELAISYTHERRQLTSASCREADKLARFRK